MTTGNIQMLTRYSAWANKLLFESLSILPGEELVQARSDGAGSILKVLNHSYVVDRIWQAHLEGVPHGYTSRNTETIPPLEELSAGQLMLDSWYINYSDNLHPDKLDEVVAFHFVDGKAGTMKRGEILLHVINHKTYHRGYVAEMLYQAGHRPPTMDIPVFLRDARPELE